MKQELKLPVIVTVVYAIFTLICVLHHEAWVDEAQVWQLCKYLSIPQLFDHLHREGHPIFFYLLVMPFAKLTSDIIYMQLICWAFMVASIFILFRYSPFHIITKFAITLSAGYTYSLPVIARPYALLPFLLFMAAILYSKQKEHPILYCTTIVVIACTHALMFVFSAFALVLFIYENLIKEKENKKKFILPSIILISSLIYVFWQVRSTLTTNTCFKTPDSYYDSALFFICSFFRNAYNLSIYLQNDAKLFHPVIDIPIIAIIVMTFICCFILVFLKNKKIFFWIFFAILFQFCVYIMYYNNYVWVTRIFIVFSLILFGFWIILNINQVTDKSRKIINIVISILFILTSYNGLNFWYMDLRQNYSGAKETAEYIKENIDKNSVILIANESFILPVQYYLDKYGYKMLSVVRGNEFKYVVYDGKDYKELHDEEWEQIAEKYSKNNKQIYVVRSHIWGGSPEIASSKFERIFHSSPAIFSQEFFLIFKYNG